MATCRRSPRSRAAAASQRGQSPAASRRRVIMFVIVPAAVARLARDSRSQRHAIVLVIGLAAAAGLARHGQAGLLSRLVLGTNGGSCAICAQSRLDEPRSARTALSCPPPPIRSPRRSRRLRSAHGRTRRPPGWAVPCPAAAARKITTAWQGHAVVQAPLHFESLAHERGNRAVCDRRLPERGVGRCEDDAASARSQRESPGSIGHASSQPRVIVSGSPAPSYGSAGISSRRRAFAWMASASVNSSTASAASISSRIPLASWLREMRSRPSGPRARPAATNTIGPVTAVRASRRDTSAYPARGRGDHHARPAAQPGAPASQCVRASRPTRWPPWWPGPDAVATTARRRRLHPAGVNGS